MHNPSLSLFSAGEVPHLLGLILSGTRKKFFLLPETSEAIAREKFAFVARTK